MGKKKSGGGGGGANDVPAHLTRGPVNADGVEIDVTTESFKTICARHASELEEINAHVASFGNGKKDKDRALRAVGVVSDRHYAEMEAWKEVNESEDEESEDEEDGDEARRAVEAVADELETKAVVRTEEEANRERQNKPSKAMLRKQKRAAEEAAREARIEAEKAALGPSEEMLESDVLKSRLAPLGLKVKDIKADGHCLYRSIDDQLVMVTGSGFEGGFEGLRRACAETMLENEWDYRPFADGCAEDAPEANAKWERYVSDVRDTATWGGQLELMALAKALGRRIQVFSASMPVVNMGEEHDISGALRVAYHRHAFGLGEHYNSVENS